MGDHEHRSLARRQVPRQPVDALDVEVVRRLVEQQQLRRVEQQLRERDAAPLATGQRPDLRLHPSGKRDRHPAEQAGQHGAERRVPRPLVLGTIAHELLADRAVAVELVALGQQRRADAAGHRDRAAVGLLGAADQPQQGGLALAVGADDPDAVAGR